VHCLWSGVMLVVVAPFGSFLICNPHLPQPVGLLYRPRLASSTASSAPAVPEGYGKIKVWFASHFLTAA